MRILVCGARGFIGRHIVQALEAAGHDVVRGVSRAARAGDVSMDFARDLSPEAWLPRLAGIEAVVNAVGILRGSARRPMQAVHAEAPAALFEACARAGVRRVIHISALGIDGNPTDYAQTKLAAERALLALNDAGRLDGVVLRPSIVFGPGGESSQLFLNLARLPWLLLPRAAIRARVQPVHVYELAEAVARLAGPARAMRGQLEGAGPEAVALAGFIASLRTQLGHRAPHVTALPDGLTQLSARMGDWVPITPWGTQALSLLTQDNVGDPGTLAQLLGRAPTHYSQLLTRSDA
ncbi:MAG: NAD-dependent epimerase/dehydratase family protein [Burkholderiaceae bacterium]|nr:NAD-dependent epimerase/dehydratase family protein [Burkholderiaceae bacterium]